MAAAWQQRSGGSGNAALASAAWRMLTMTAMVMMTTIIDY
jgi:hypothetical protein